VLVTVNAENTAGIAHEATIIAAMSAGAALFVINCLAFMLSLIIQIK